jgi:hypothetical protein
MESVFLTVVGSELEIGTARDSFERIYKRATDSNLNHARATKGYEARQQLIDIFLNETTHDYIYLADADELQPPDILERLRSHNLPYVSGFYMRRNYEHLAPIWFRPYDGSLPYKPWVGKIEPGKLHKIGASGWGSILVHREVILAVRELLKGELEVIEDDMDVYPYDLKRVMGAINGLRKLQIHGYDKNAAERYIRDLEQEIKPLRVLKDDIVGSDVRFPFFALQAGYQLYGDPDAVVGHFVNYPLGIEDYNRVPDWLMNKYIEEMEERVEKGKQIISNERIKVIYE